MEVLLEQANAIEAGELLEKTGNHEFFLSDYALHSIGLLLLRRGRPAAFRDFLKDIITDAAVTFVSLPLDEMETVIDAAAAFQLDFDDAYQYVVAGKYGLGIVSYDSDFDRTPLGRLVPKHIP